MLLRTWLDITSAWHAAFRQQRLFRRAVAQALGILTALGRRTLTRTLWATGRQQQDWSADYRLHARAHWSPDHLFQPILGRALPLCQGPYICVAIDDTRLRKTGRKILSAFYQRDPLSPKFHFNLMYGLRFLQMSLLVPLYRMADQPARGLPLRFEEAPLAKKPRKKASQAEWDAWRELRAKQNLSTLAVLIIQGMRVSLDLAGAAAKRLLVVADNSFCNRTLFRAELIGTAIVARARRDLKLCYRASNRARFYAAEKFTPEEARNNKALPWHKAKVFHGGRWRRLRYKLLSQLYWENGGGRRPLRLLIVAPIPYSVPGSPRKSYREPVFLLTTDLQASPAQLLQASLDRWQIEVNHREEKDTLGVGQAQVRSARSVPRQPAFAVASYSALLLAGLLAFGPQREAAFPELPKWRRNAIRPSCLDLITLLRKEMVENRSLLMPFGLKVDWKTLGLAANA